MKFTFGIITDGKSDNTLNIVIDSIERQNIPEYEVLIIGNSKISRNNTRVISFDDSIKPKWITRKKNLITLHAKYDNIVYTHDYVTFEDGWYDGYLKFGDDFKVCMNVFLNSDSTRFRDWVIWPHNGSQTDKIVADNKRCLIPYDMDHLSKHQYISGTYWVAKKDVMMEFPLDERLVHSQGEDVAWSKMIRQKYNFSMNSFSFVKSLKFKNVVFNVTTEETNKKLMEVK
jgi:hypothetical protein